MGNEQCFTEFVFSSNTGIYVLVIYVQEFRKWEYGVEITSSEI